MCVTRWPQSDEHGGQGGSWRNSQARSAPGFKRHHEVVIVEEIARPVTIEVGRSSAAAVSPLKAHDKGIVIKEVDRSVAIEVRGANGQEAGFTRHTPAFIRDDASVGVKAMSRRDIGLEFEFDVVARRAGDGTDPCARRSPKVAICQVDPGVGRVARLPTKCRVSAGLCRDGELDSSIEARRAVPRLRRDLCRGNVVESSEVALALHGLSKPRTNASKEPRVPSPLKSVLGVVLPLSKATTNSS